MKTNRFKPVYFIVMSLIVIFIILLSVFLLRNSKNIVISIDSNSSDESISSTFFLEGEEYQRNGYYEKAINAYCEAINLNKANQLAYMRRGDAYSKTGQIENALKDYKKTVELNPDNAEAYMRIGLIFSFRQDFEQAIYYYNFSLKKDPSLIVAYLNKAVFLLKNNRIEEALETCNEGITKSNSKSNEIDLARIYLLRGDICAKNFKDYKKALNDYKNATLIEPNLPGAYFNMGTIYEKSDNKTKAYETYKKLYNILSNEENLKKFIEQPRDQYFFKGMLEETQKRIFRLEKELKKSD